MKDLWIFFICNVLFDKYFRDICLHHSSDKFLGVHVQVHIPFIDQYINSNMYIFF